MTAKQRTYSRYTTEAIHLLAQQIKLARKQRHWTENELAERAGISRATLQKIEKGNMSCAIGLFFELAVLVGIKLFDSDNVSLAIQQERVNDKIALLPGAIHKNKKPLDDDF